MIPDPVLVECIPCKRFGRYRRARFFEIAGVADPPSALLGFAAARGCATAQAQIAASKTGMPFHAPRCQCTYMITGPGPLQD